MNTKKIVSIFFVLAMIVGPVVAQTAEPARHDHQKTKGSGLSSVPKDDKAREDCKPSGKEATAKESATDSKAKCEPAKSSTKSHDHRKVKNLQ
jgi:hypothetical protein